MTRTEFFALLATVCWMAAINVGMVLKLGLSPWLLIIPFAVIGLTFPHPKTRALRDGLFLLLVAVAVLRSFAGKAIEREIHWSLGVASVSAITLGFVVYTHRDGFGIPMRRAGGWLKSQFTWRGWGVLSRFLADTLGNVLLLGFVSLTLFGVLRRPDARPELPYLLFAAIAIALSPQAWSDLRHKIIPYIAVLPIGYAFMSLASAWPWTNAYATFLIAALIFLIESCRRGLSQTSSRSKAVEAA